MIAGAVMPLPGRYGPPPVPPPEPAPMPAPSPSPTPVPCPVPVPPAVPGPRLSLSTGGAGFAAIHGTPARSRGSAATVTTGATTAGSGFTGGRSGLTTGGGSTRGRGQLVHVPRTDTCRARDLAHGVDIRKVGAGIHEILGRDAADSGGRERKGCSIGFSVDHGLICCAAPPGTVANQRQVFILCYNRASRAGLQPGHSGEPSRSAHEPGEHANRSGDRRVER